MNPAAPNWPELNALRASGAAQRDAVGWHYIETLARRTQAQSGPAQHLLQTKLRKELQRFEKRLNTNARPQPLVPKTLQPSPMTTLLQHMRPQNASTISGKTLGLPTENPRFHQFKKQLSQISVQKQVTQAIAQAPHNAGPINSHMLVLRSLGLMRNISPDYLNRFMTHVDTLLCLEEAGKGKLTPKKAAPSAKARS